MHSNCDLTKLLQLYSKEGLPTLATWEPGASKMAIYKDGLDLGLLYDCIMSASALRDHDPEIWGDLTNGQ